MHLESLFAAARSAAESGGVLRALFGRSHWLYRDIVGVLPVRALGAQQFEVLDASTARTRDLRPVIAVRGGALEMDVMPASVECDPVHGCPTAHGAMMLESWAALRGDTVFDLLACDWAMQRPPRVLLGAADALGFGADGQGSDPDDMPVTLCRSLREWVGTLFAARGCLPLGDATRQADTIRRFQGGVVCQDLAHGLAVEKLLRRDLPPPPRILVHPPQVAAA